MVKRPSVFHRTKNLKSSINMGNGDFDPRKRYKKSIKFFLNDNF